MIVPALLDAETRKRCRPVVVGDAKRLRLAATVLGIDVDVVAIEEIKDAEFIDGRINVIDLDLLPEDLAWGELSAVAGMRPINISASQANSPYAVKSSRSARRR